MEDNNLNQQLQSQQQNQTEQAENNLPLSQQQNQTLVQQQPQELQQDIQQYDIPLQQQTQEENQIQQQIIQQQQLEQNQDIHNNNDEQNFSQVENQQQQQEQIQQNNNNVSESEKQYLDQILEELLPQIKQEIENELQKEYQTQYEQDLEKAVNGSKEKANSIIQEKVEKIHEETLQIYKDSKDIYDRELAELEAWKQGLEVKYEQQYKEENKEQFEKEKQELLKSVFDDMTKSKSMADLEKQIISKIKQEFQDDHKIQLQKKEKLLKLNYHKKFTMEKENLEKEYEEKITKEIDLEIQNYQEQRADIQRQIVIKNQGMKDMEQEKKGLKNEIQNQQEYYTENIQNLQNILEQLVNNREKNQIEKQERERQEQEKLIERQKKEQEILQHVQFQKNLDKQQQQLQKQDFISQQEQSIQNQNDIINNQRQKVQDQQMENSQIMDNFNKSFQQQQQKQDEFAQKYLFAGSNNDGNNNQFGNTQQQQDQKPYSTLDPLSPPQQQQHQNQYSQKPSILGNYNAKQMANSIMQRIQQELPQNKQQIPQQQIQNGQQQYFNSFQQQQQYPFQTNPSENDFSGFHQQQPQLKIPFSEIKQVDNLGPQLSDQKLINEYDASQQNFNQNQYPADIQQQFDQYGYSQSQYDQYKGGENQLNKENQFILDQKYKSIIQQFRDNLSARITNKDQNEQENMFVSQDQQQLQNQNQQQSQTISHRHKLSKYESFFLLTKKDNKKEREMKLLRKGIYHLLEQEHHMEIKYNSYKEYYLEDFVRSITRQYDNETYENLYQQFQELFEVQDLADQSMADRVEFLNQIETNLKSLESVQKKLILELEYLSSTKLDNSAKQIQDKLLQRMAFRKQIDIYNPNFSYKYNKRPYQAIKNVGEQIKHLLQNRPNQTYIWKGIDVQDLILVDKWEDDKVQKEELRETITKKLSKKFNS